MFYLLLDIKHFHQKNKKQIRVILIITYKSHMYRQKWLGYTKINLQP